MTMAEESREVREARAPVWEAEVPWVVSYLREDIQDLRNEVREVRRLTVESYEKLDAKIEGLRQDMDTKIEGLRQDMDTKIEGLRQDMGVQLRWIIGIVIGAILTMTGVFAWIVDRMLKP
jgi:hypothetical protein